MKEPDINVSITPHDGKVLMECSACGPVAVTDLHPILAVRLHFSQTHAIFATYIVPTERQS